MNTGHSILLIAIASGITFLIRAFPFLVFKKRQMPAFLKEIADKLPPAIIAVLVIYCLKGPLTVLDTETIAAAIAIGLASAAGAIGMGIAIAKSSEGISRQPEASDKIRTGLMLGLVFIETAIIYALIVAILIVFVL